MLMKMPVRKSHRARGLLIEPSEETREKIIALISPKIEFEGAGTIQEAMEKISEDPDFDFVLLDWECVEKNGLGALKQLSISLSKPLIILANKDLSSEEAQRLFDSGAVSCLSKEDLDFKTSNTALPPRFCLELLNAATTGVEQEIKDCFRKLDAVIAKLQE